MTKKVVYNGETVSYTGSTNPKVLQKGWMYEVERVDVGKWQTDYKLKGIDGLFNSIWFDDVPAYLAVASEKPEVGQRIYGIKVFKNGKWEKYRYTSMVEEVRKISETIYEATTAHTIYVVQVL